MKTPTNPVSEPVLDVPLFPGVPPLHRPADDTLREHFLPTSDFCSRLTDVSEPTFSFFPATGPGPLPLVIVCPGGGYEFLAWNHEGTDVCAWLVSRGVNAMLLKYRCPDRRDQALADIRRAIRIARANAEAWDVDPARIGVLGFSAGANLAIRACCSTEPEPPAVDAIDALPRAPDFAILVYPAYIARDGFATDPTLDIRKQTVPPTFLVQSQDDSWWESSVAYAIALRKAGVPFELHLLADGGHGWGIPRRGHAPDAWTDLADHWLRTQAFRREPRTPSDD